MSKKAMLATARSTQGKRILRNTAGAINEARLTESEAREAAGSRKFQQGFIALLRECSAKQPDYSLAQSILGVDFITPEEIMKATAVVYSKKQLASLHGAIPPEDVLRWCKEHNFAVVAAPLNPINLLNVRALDNSLFYSKEGGWYAEQKFASENKTGPGWLMIRKDPVPNSTRKTWDEQNKLISGVERVPNAAEVSWLVTTYFKVRGVRLFESIYVRCSDLDSDGDRVGVGRFGAGGLGVDGIWGGRRDERLGVASARK
jgi:hypothetical protein